MQAQETGAPCNHGDEMSVLENGLKLGLSGPDNDPGQLKPGRPPLLAATLAVLCLAAAITAGNLVSVGRSVTLLASPGEAAETPAIGASKERAGLSASMALALESVAQRYRVSPEALQPVFLAAQAAAKDIDPLLIIAVIGIESGFNPFAQSVMGAQGLMQVIPRFHRAKLPPQAGNGAFLDPINNVNVGVQVLQEAIRRQGGLVEGLQYYAGAIDDPERGYANRVIAEKQRLEFAVRARKPQAAGAAQARSIPPPAKDTPQKSD